MDVMLVLVALGVYAPPTEDAFERHADIAYSYLAVTKESIYADEPQPLAPRPADHKYLIVYPMWKKREWYRLSADERMAIMREHIAVARQFPNISTNTAYSFGLDDQEFVVAFECDEPAAFLDLVMELRESQASRYTERETPIFTCVRMAPAEALQLALGLRAAESGEEPELQRQVSLIAGR